MKKKYCCKVCGTKICSHAFLYGLGMCKSCSHKGELNHKFINGNSYKESSCIDCGKKLSKKAYFYSSIRCKSCAMKYQFATKKHPRMTHGMSLKKHYCKCGEEINWRTVTKGKGMCSSCAMSHRMFTEEWKNNISKATKGDKNPNWIDGRSFEDYPVEFNDELKLKIRDRDDHICQNCGMTEEEHFIVYGSNLAIHHIDYNKKNCKEDNLLTLCDGCNLRANWNRNYWQEFYMEKIYGKYNIQNKRFN